MEITYKNKKIKDVCQNYTKAVKAYGENIAEKIHLRVMQIEAAESVEFMMSHNIGRCHKLKNNRKGEYAVDLAHPYRLVFEVKGEEIEIAKILEVVDYHWKLDVIGGY